MRVLLTILILFAWCGSSFAPACAEASPFASASGDKSAGRQDQHKIDSLETVLQTTKVDTTRIKTLNALAWELKYNNPDTSIYYSKQALALAEKKDLQKEIANSYRDLGAFNWIKGNYPLALDHYNKALKINEQLSDKKGIATIHGNIGSIYSNQGDYPKALEYYFNALKINKELGNKSHIATLLGNIGVIYYKQDDCPKAQEYYFKALKISEELGDKKEIAITTGNIGVIYYEQDDYSKAQECYFKALKISEELGSKSHIAAWLGNIGIVYKEQCDLSTDDSVRQAGYSKALEYYFKALKMNKELGDKRSIAINLGNIGSLYIHQKKCTEAERYLLQAQELTKEIGALYYEKIWHQNLSKLYAETNRYQLAYEHHKAYSVAKDSLFNEEKSKDIGKLEAKHEFEMAEQERKRQEEEQARVQEEQESRRNNLQYSGILIFMVLIFAGIFMLGRFSIPVRLAEGMIFFAFLLFFEFALVLLDPYIEQYSSGAPAIKLGFNALLAACIFPLHSFFENKLKARING